MKKYAIKCVNRGMWGGIATLLRNNDKTIIYNTEEEARREVDKIRELHGNINNFSEYFVTEIEVEE